MVREAFADLDYDESGHIIIEPDPWAKSPQRCGDQAVAVLRGEVTSVAGTPIAVEADTISCTATDRMRWSQPAGSRWSDGSMRESPR